MDKSIIICEGKTDAILLSYYLNAIQGWQSVKMIGKPERRKYEEKIKNVVEFNIKDPVTQEVNWYVKNDELLCIIAVGSISMITEYFDKVLEINYLMKEDTENFKKIAILADRDDKATESQLINELSNSLKEKNANITIEHNNWNKIINFQNQFEKIISLDLFVLLLPIEEEGALETFLLNALSKNDKTDEKVILQCTTFIENLDSYIEETGDKKYLIGRGEVLKAKFATFFAIASPRRVFDSGDKILKSVNWKELSYINESFKVLVAGL